MFKRMASLALAAAVLAAALSSCAPNKIPDQPLPLTSSDSDTFQPEQQEQWDVSDGDELYGAYLTTYSPSQYTEGFPQLIKFASYSEVENYFYGHERAFFFGARFTVACASFTDDFLAENDVMMLVIDEPSAYASFSCSDITVENGKARFKLERHIPQDAPSSENIAYHLVFCAPKDSYDKIDVSDFEVDISEIIDSGGDNVFDAERFRYTYPEFWPSTHKADALTQASPVIMSIHSYDELLSFYESKKAEFDLDSEFLPQIGFSYTEELFNDYVVLMALLPFDSRFPAPRISNVFVYNMKIWISINGYAEQIPEEYTVWYLVTAAVAKRDIEGVNLNEFNIGGTQTAG